jgi:hypothetical protein
VNAARAAALSRLQREWIGVGLRTDGDILAGGHRHHAGDQAGDARYQDIVLCRGRRGDTEDQARCRDDTIVGPEYGGSQPLDAGDEMALRMNAKAAHIFS